MFAPPSPLAASRPTSAASYHQHPHHQPYIQPRSSISHEHGLPQSNSFSWKAELGLPPPPSEIDSLGHSLDHALVSLSRPASRSQSVSPTSRVPSRYDVEFGGPEDPTEHRDRTQDHMNMVSKHPKVKIDVILSSSLFEAGGSISGKVELTCTTGQRLRIGQIAIELEAVEQLTSRDHAATQLFLYNRTVFQGEKLPPSNAVLPAAPINGYWTARKGRTSFPFSFRLPASAPSCVTFAGNASLRYGLKATVQTWYNDEKMIVTARREAFVLEKWSDQLHPRFRQPVEAVGDTRLFMGGNGPVWLEAGVTEQLFWGGGQLLIRCGIKNNTKRHLSGIKVALARRLIFPVGSVEGFHDSPEKLSLEPRITEIVHDQVFKGREYEFVPDAESVCTVAVDVPRDLRTIRKTRLFEVRTFAFVSLLLGSFAKDLTVEIPIYVAHTASAQHPVEPTLDNLHTGHPLLSMPQRPNSSIGHSQGRSHGHAHPQHPQPHFYNPHDGHRAQPHPHMDAGMLEMERLAAERGWSPAPVMTGSAHLAGPMRSASTAPGMIQLPSQAQPFALGPDGHLQWDPTANSWNASRLMSPPAAAAGHALQRSASAAPDMLQNAAPSQSFAQHVDPVAAWTASQRAMSASPGPAAFAHQGSFVAAAASPHQPAMPFSQFASAATSDRRASLPAAGPYGGALPPQVAYANAPRETLPPMPEPQSIVVPGPSTQQFSAPPPQPSMPMYSGGAPPIAGLATIEEDSESQAGTVKTMSKLPTIGKTGTKGAKGTKGNSVSRNNIEQFEAMAEAEEDEEEVKRQMIAMGMQPDEEAFNKANEEPVPAAAPETTPRASASRRSETSHASATGTFRLKASEIFQDGAAAEVPASQPASYSSEVSASVQTAANVVQSQHGSPSMDIRRTSEDQPAAARSIVSLRRSSSSQGMGLQALETNLVRSTTPKISSTPRAAAVTLANVGRAEHTSSPLSPAPAVFDDSTRSRKNSALRAAALAREEAERKSAEEQTRAAEERQRQLQAEQARQAAAAEEEAARKEAARARAAEQQRLERERIAEEARRQRELREKEEEQRAREEAERRAEMERVQWEEEVRRREREEKERREQEEQQRREREESERRSRQAAEAAAAQARLQSERIKARESNSVASSPIQRIHAAIGHVPSSIAPSVPSKTTAPILASPGRTSDRDRLVLKQQAVHRVDGWLSNPASPNTSHMNSPGTPSASVLSMMRKDEAPAASGSRGDTNRSSFADRSPSQVINPMWDGKSSRLQTSASAMPKSHTMADLASSKRSVAMAEDDEPVPELSAELRALVDGSDIRPARKSGKALKEHPISRRLSGLGSTAPAPAAVVPSSSFASSSSQQARRDGHTSSPSWPRPGLPSFAGTGSNVKAAIPAIAPAAKLNNERRVSREVGIPTRVEKTLAAPPATKEEAGGYDVRSARGGRGGRVASVTQLWSKIAGDVDDDAALSPNLAAPQSEAPRSASPSNTSTFKPKPRTSATGGAPALDFSSKTTTSSPTSSGVTSIAATFGSSTPESLKTSTAVQFLNTSTPKPVFSRSPEQAGKPEKRPLPKPVLQPGALPAPQLVRPTAMRAQPSPKSKRLSTRLLSNFEAKEEGEGEESMREMMDKVALDPTIMGAFGEGGMGTWRCADGSEVKMSGRGTTKAIGESKYNSLRAVWGS
ncbi:Arrestin_C domain-containing protein [Pseudozyma hubeiensis]|nr:Arrestin_C domain-containing protein [Pseudozyma hubeiensis]